MFVASYSRTMANARFKTMETDPDVAFKSVDVTSRYDRQRRIRVTYKAPEIMRLAEVRKEIAVEKAKVRARAVLTEGKAQKLARIQARAVLAFGVTYEDLRGNSRLKEIAFARQFVAYWACRLTDLSFPQIGRLMGRDHTTVLHGRDAYPAKRKAMGRYLREVRYDRHTGGYSSGCSRSGAGI